MSEQQPCFMLCYIIYVHIQETKHQIYKMCGYFKLNWLYFKKNYYDILYPVLIGNNFNL